MKFADMLGLLFPVAIVFGLISFHEGFIALTLAHPFVMGFAKVAALATYGEMLKTRLTKNRWHIQRPITRFMVWGLFGTWFAAAFPFISGGVMHLVEKGLWPNGPTIWLAFSKSLWINFLGGYGFSMMLTHEYFNRSIERGNLISLTAFAECMSNPNAGKMWYRFIPLSLLFFWLGAQTVTFLLPPVYYVLMAAALAVALGFILSIAHRS